MITIEHTPEEVSLIGNPINYLVSSNNVLEDTAVAARAAMVKSHTPIVADDYFEITYQGRTIRFTAKENPDDSGTQIPLGTLSEVADAIALNYYINRDFNIWTKILPGINLMYIQPKIADEAYTFMTDVTHFPFFRNSDLTDQQTHVCVSQKIKEGFLYVANTYDNANNIIGTDQLPANSELKALFNIQEYFFEKLIPSFIYPHTATIANLKADMCFEYAVKFAEGTGIPTVFGQLKPDTVRRVIGGGIPQWQQKQLQDDSSTFWAYLTETKRFLNWYPGTKETTRTGSEKLYHIATNADATQASLFVRVYFSDGTNATYERAVISNYAKFNIYELFVDFASLQLDDVEANSNKTIETYDVWLWTSIDYVDTYLSEVRTYELVSETANDRLLIFRNSLATYETIRMTGNMDKSTAFTREVSNMLFPQEFIDTFRQKTSRITDTEERITINTGYTDNIEITNWWMELLSSDDVYYWDGTRLISAVITNEEVLQYSDEEPVYNLALELMLSNASAGSVGLQGNYYSSLVNNGVNATQILNTQLTDLTEFPTLTNISSADTLFSWARKFMKLFNSLKALAFKNKADWSSDIDNIPGTFPPSAHAHSVYQELDKKDVIGGYPGIDQATQKILPQWLPAAAETKKLVIQKNIAMGGGSCWAIVCGDRIIENVYGTLRKFDFSGSWISSTAAARVPSVNQNVWNNSEKFAINNLTTGIVDIYTKECSLVGSVNLSNYVNGNSIVGFIMGDYLYWANSGNADHSVYKLSLTDFSQTTALNITTGNGVSDLKMAEFNGEYRIFYYSIYGTRIFDVNFNVLKTFSSYSDYYRVSGRYLFYKCYNSSPSSLEVYDLFSANIPLVCNTDIVLFGDIKQLTGDIYYGVTTTSNNGYNSELVVFNPVINKVLATVPFFLYGYYVNAIQKPLYYKISDSKIMLWGYTALFKIISYE